jgi:hypothetical protein
MSSSGRGHRAYGRDLRPRHLALCERRRRVLPSGSNRRTGSFVAHASWALFAFCGFTAIIGFGWERWAKSEVAAMEQKELGPPHRAL